MEDNKNFDFKTLIGFILIGAIILFWLSSKQKDVQKEKTKTEAVQKAKVDSIALAKKDSIKAHPQDQPVVASDSAALAHADNSLNLGIFAKDTVPQSAENTTTTLENDVLEIEVSNKGGQIAMVRLKGMVSYDSMPIYLVKDHSSTFNLRFTTDDNRVINTKNLLFEPTLTTDGEHKTLSMKLQVSPDQYIEYVYTLSPDKYMMGFTLKSHGFKDIINSSKTVALNWKMKGYRHDKSIRYEGRYTRLNWLYDGDKTSKQTTRGSGKDTSKDISWVAYRQHSFSSILINDPPFQKGLLKSDYLVEDLTKDTVFIKSFSSSFPLKLENGEVHETMKLYYGPTNYQLLKKYGHHLSDVVPLGWGIFGWINRHLIIPLFTFLIGFLPAGIAIIVLTVIVKILLSPVQYKQFLSQAKQQILKPEIEEINERVKDKMKRQQETMKLNRKAGINPTSGCLVGLIQLPVFYAMYEFFPSAFVLRGQGFLWANDLSSYDSIMQLPFSIPMYGSHVSLFALLAAIAILIYMMLTTGQSMQMQKQPGMPNMKFIMYLSPIFMLVFFNRYASGLALYYLTSNLISILLYLVIRNYIIDDDKVIAKIQKNKKNPKKQGRFQRKMQQLMEEAERQKNAKK